MMNWPAFYLALLLAFVSGCAGDAAPMANNLADSEGRKPVVERTSMIEGGWSIQYWVSGGIAGIRQKYSVDSDGLFVVVNEKSQEQKEGVLTLGQMDVMEQRLLALKGSPLYKDGSMFHSQCADCVVHRLRARVAGKHYIVSVRSGDQPPPAYAALLNELSTMLKRALGE